MPLGDATKETRTDQAKCEVGHACVGGEKSACTVYRRLHLNVRSGIGDARSGLGFVGSCRRDPPYNVGLYLALRAMENIFLKTRFHVHK